MHTGHPAAVLLCSYFCLCSCSLLAFFIHTLITYFCWLIKFSSIHYKKWIAIKYLNVITIKLSGLRSPICKLSTYSRNLLFTYRFFFLARITHFTFLINGSLVYQCGMEYMSLFYGLSEVKQYNLELSNSYEFMICCLIPHLQYDSIDFWPFLCLGWLYRLKFKNRFESLL